MYDPGYNLTGKSTCAHQANNILVDDEYSNLASYVAMRDPYWSSSPQPPTVVCIGPAGSLGTGREVTGRRGPHKLPEEQTRTISVLREDLYRYNRYHKLLTT